MNAQPDLGRPPYGLRAWDFRVVNRWEGVAADDLGYCRVTLEARPPAAAYDPWTWDLARTASGAPLTVRVTREEWEALAIGAVVTITLDLGL